MDNRKEPKGLDQALDDIIAAKRDRARANAPGPVRRVPQSFVSRRGQNNQANEEDGPPPGWRAADVGIQDARQVLNKTRMLQAAAGQRPLAGRPAMGFPGGQPFPAGPPFPGGQHFPGGAPFPGGPAFVGRTPFPGRPHFVGPPAFPGNQPFPGGPFAAALVPFDNGIFAASQAPLIRPGVVTCFKCGGIGHKADVCPSVKAEIHALARPGLGPRPAGSGPASQSAQARLAQHAHSVPAAAATMAVEPQSDPYQYLQYETVFQDEETQEVVIKLREVEIVMVRANGDIVLNSGGLKDDITFAAINAALGIYGLRVSQSVGADGSPSWRVTDGKAILRRFEDGMVIPQVPPGGMARIERLLKVKQADDPGKAAVEAAEEVAVATAKAPDLVPGGRGAGRGARGRGTSVWSRGASAIGATRYAPY